MKLTQEQRDKIAQTLLSKNQFMTCPMCKEGLNVLTDVYTIPAFDVSNETLNLPNSPMTPCAGLMCKNCGNIVFFNLGVLGIDYK